MWCLCSIPKHSTATPFYKPLIPSVSATSEPRRRRLDVSTNQQVGELGHTLLATLQPNPNPNPNPIPNPKQRNQESEETPISGSDVLWALQRASARKKKKKHGRGLSSVASRTEQSAVDYSNVRPLCINAHWPAKLDDLEKRLRELSDTI